MKTVPAGFKRRFLLPAMVCLGWLTSLRADTNRVALAGWAEIEITPPLGIALGGRGGPGTLANKVLDPLYAQVLYLKDGKGTGFVLVSFDIVGITHELGDRIRTAI